MRALSDVPLQIPLVEACAPRSAEGRDRRSALGPRRGVQIPASWVCTSSPRGLAGAWVEIVRPHHFDVARLKGFPEAIEAIFPKTTVQTCIVHLLRHSLKYVPRKEREQVARALKPVYTATDADAAQVELERFDEKWGRRFPVITQAWLNAWEYVIPFLAFPAEVRRVIYTTNATEALNRQLRKAIKTKGHFPNEDAARKLIYLALVNAVPQWTRTRNWTAALLAFKIHFGDRLPDTAN